MLQMLKLQNLNSQIAQATEYLKYFQENMGKTQFKDTNWSYFWQGIKGEPESSLYIFLKSCYYYEPHILSFIS